MSEPAISDINSALGRALHYLYCKHTRIYHSDRDIESSWAADGKDRNMWIADRGDEFRRMMLVLGWEPPKESVELNAYELTHALLTE